ncbi:MAG TPA: hypothetical protein DCX53_04870 [Anaerolineae bacterium]|nr:hypothetical protein [Anaerolineae bacterium]
MIRLAYTIITLGSSTLWGVVSGWLIYFYLPPGETPLVPLAFYSIVIILSKVINIVIGLPIGYLSDHTKSGWGRRLPYVISGAIFLPILFVLLWTPPTTYESNLNLLYIFIILIAFNLAYEIHQIPYESLLPELAIGEKDRVTISSWKTGFLLGGNVLAGFAGPMIGSLGYVTSMWIFAIIVSPFMILPGFFLRRHINTSYRPPQLIRRITFIKGLNTTFRNRNFQIFSISWVMFWTGAALVLETMPFIVTEICRLDEADAVYFYLPAIIVTLLAFPFVIRLSERYGMKTIYRGSLLAGAISLSAIMLIGDWIPIPLIAQGIIWVVIQSASLAGAQILPTAMIADIIDRDEPLTGQRREGSYYSVWAMLNQVSSGVATAVIPLFFLFGRSQVDPQGPLGVRLLGLLGGVLLLIAFWVFRNYKLGMGLR